MMYYIIYSSYLRNGRLTTGPGERQHSGKSRGTSASELASYHFSLLEKKRSELALGLDISLALSRIDKSSCLGLEFMSHHFLDEIRRVSSVDPVHKLPLIE